MADNRDYRVRAFLYIENEGIALGLYDHVLEQKEDAVDINPDTPHAEMRLVEFGDAHIVEYDLAFPPEEQGKARGLFNHSKNINAVKYPDAEEGMQTGYVSLERCGHRIKESCEIIERYDVE
ncbi:hypothetical protein LCGC14_1558860 [marine sediment metagenome]|uniref:Uncharacterized protein n=1 Tax=marine sediment metagenome TaxID=412755 RepID=A0A0F9IN49_9ZZZZ